MWTRWSPVDGPGAGVDRRTAQVYILGVMTAQCKRMVCSCLGLSSPGSILGFCQLCPDSQSPHGREPRSRGLGTLHSNVFPFLSLSFPLESFKELFPWSTCKERWCLLTRALCPHQEADRGPGSRPGIWLAGPGGVAPSSVPVSACLQTRPSQRSFSARVLVRLSLPHFPSVSVLL